MREARQYSLIKKALCKHRSSQRARPSRKGGTKERMPMSMKIHIHPSIYTHMCHAYVQAASKNCVARRRCSCMCMCVVCVHAYVVAVKYLSTNDHQARQWRRVHRSIIVVSRARASKREFPSFVRFFFFFRREDDPRSVHVGSGMCKGTV